MKKNQAQKIIDNVEKMRANSKNQLMHRNIPLAKECLAMLETLDDPEEGPLGKAYACNAIIEQLPEYDVPRFVLGILHRELAWLNEGEEKSEWLTAGSVQKDIARLEDYICADAMSMKEFCSKYGRHLLFDPVERSSRWEELYYDVETECERRLEGEPRCMGFCFAYWAEKRNVLAAYGIDWKSPSVMNPRVMFD